MMEQVMSEKTRKPRMKPEPAAKESIVVQITYPDIRAMLDRLQARQRAKTGVPTLSLGMSLAMLVMEADKGTRG